jgi:hypothetical protein
MSGNMPQAAVERKWLFAEKGNPTLPAKETPDCHEDTPH